MTKEDLFNLAKNYLMTLSLDEHVIDDLYKRPELQSAFAAIGFQWLRYEALKDSAPKDI